MLPFLCWARCACLNSLSLLRICLLNSLVITALKQRLGLRADEPRTDGSGNANDGNTVRRAFRSSAEFAACTGVDEQLILDLYVILQAISCFYKPDSSTLSSFCHLTARRYVELYGWCTMR